MTEDEFDLRHEVAFGVLKTLCRDGHLLLKGNCTRGRIVPGQVFTELWDGQLTISGDHCWMTYDPVGPVRIRVIAITMFGKNMEWIKEGDGCILKVDGEGGDWIAGGLYLSIPATHPSS